MKALVLRADLWKGVESPGWKCWKVGGGGRPGGWRERERERERESSQSVSQSVPGKCGDTPVSLTICRVTGNIRSSSSKWSLLSLLLVERLEEISQCESLSLSGLAAVLRPGWIRESR